MKRLLVLLLLLCGYAEGTTFTPKLTEVCHWHDATASAYQGLAYDGAYFYVGNSNDNKIYKFDKDSCDAVVTSFTCPTYCGPTIRTDHDNLLAVAGGTGNSVVLWEITKTGTKVREWDFSAESAERSYDECGVVAYAGENKIFLLTADCTGGTPYPFKVSLYTINDNGTFTWHKTWSHTGLELVQAIWWDPVTQRLFYAVRQTLDTDNRIYELKLNDDNSITVLNIAQVAKNGTYSEIEGLAVYGRDIYYSTWINTGPYYVYKIGFEDIFTPRGSKFNNIALGSNPSGITKWNGVKWGQVAGSVNKLNNIAKSSYYCNIESLNSCQDYANGGDILCEVWNSDDTNNYAGYCDWTRQGANCTLTFNQTPDNDPALACTNIRDTATEMSYVFQLYKNDATSAVCSAYHDFTTAAFSNKYYAQFYFKVVDSSQVTDGQGIGLFQIGAAQTGNSPMIARIYHTGGKLYLDVGYNNNGTWTWDTGRTEIADDTWYGVRMHYDETADPNNAVYQWWMDASNDGTWTAKGNTTFIVQSARQDLRYVILGEGSATTVKVTNQMTGFKVSSYGFTAGCER